MNVHTTDYAAARKFMTEGQIKPNDITDQKLLRAFLTVPREHFVPDSLRNVAYAERAIPFNTQRQMLPPLTLAKMIQALDIKNNSAILDIAGAPGYTAALLASMGNTVTVLEENDTLVENTRNVLGSCAVDNVQIVKGTFSDGFALAAPYDCIILEGAVAAVPLHLVSSLKEGGRLVTILVSARGSKIMLYTRVGEKLSGQPVFDSFAPFLPGYEPAEQFVF